MDSRFITRSLITPVLLASAILFNATLSSADEIRLVMGQPHVDARIAELSVQEWEDVGAGLDAAFEGTEGAITEADGQDSKTWGQIIGQFFSAVIGRGKSVVGDHDYPAFVGIGRQIGIEITPKISEKIFNILPQLRKFPVAAGYQISVNLMVIPTYNPEQGIDIYLSMNELDGFNIGLNNKGEQTFGGIFFMVSPTSTDDAGMRTFAAKSPKDLYGVYYGVEGEFGLPQFRGTAHSFEGAAYIHRTNDGLYGGSVASIMYQVSFTQEDKSTVSVQGERLVLRDIGSVQVVRDAKALGEKVTDVLFWPGRKIGDSIGGLIYGDEKAAPTSEEIEAYSQKMKSKK